MKYNEGILSELTRRCRGDHHGALRLYGDLCQRWPQINEDTRVDYVPHYQEAVTFTEVEPTPVRHFIETWRYWRWMLFPSIPLDNPHIRWLYQKTVFRFIWRFPLLLWRWATGQMKDDTPPATTTYHEERVDLDVLSWQFSHDPHSAGRMKCGYSASRDTFFVQRQKPDFSYMNRPDAHFLGDADILRTFKFGDS